MAKRSSGYHETFAAALDALLGFGPLGEPEEEVSDEEAEERHYQETRAAHQQPGTGCRTCDWVAAQEAQREAK